MAFESVKFRVIGRGEFPYDMLRYDGCWPYDSESAGKLATPPVYMGEDVYAKFRHEYRVLTLVGRKERRYWQPTSGRWSSFGWTVINESIHGTETDDKVQAWYNQGRVSPKDQPGVS